jgi:hypothetical protein
MRTVRTLGYAEARSFEWDQGDSLWPRSRSNTGLRSGTDMGASGGGGILVPRTGTASCRHGLLELVYWIPHEGVQGTGLVQ